jgi:putative endonuclease
MLWRRRQPKTDKELGRIGEDHAARYLASRGYTIKERNYRAAGRVEIDIVAEHKGVLAFIEVKARRLAGSAEAFRPSTNVTPWKQHQIVRAAGLYLSSRERRERVTRFDVVEVHMTPQGRVSKVELIEGAFQA